MSQIAASQREGTSRQRPHPFFTASQAGPSRLPMRTPEVIDLTLDNDDEPEPTPMLGGKPKPTVSRNAIASSSRLRPQYDDDVAELPLPASQTSFAGACSTQRSRVTAGVPATQYPSVTPRRPPKTGSTMYDAISLASTSNSSSSGAPEPVRASGSGSFGAHRKKRSITPKEGRGKMVRTVSREELESDSVSRRTDIGRSLAGKEGVCKFRLSGTPTQTPTQQLKRLRAATDRGQDGDQDIGSLASQALAPGLASSATSMKRTFDPSSFFLPRKAPPHIEMAKSRSRDAYTPVNVASSIKSVERAAGVGMGASMGTATDRSAAPSKRQFEPLFPSSPEHQASPSASQVLQSKTATVERSDRASRPGPGPGRTSSKEILIAASPDPPPSPKPLVRSVSKRVVPAAVPSTTVRHLDDSSPSSLRSVIEAQPRLLPPASQRAPLMPTQSRQKTQPTPLLLAQSAKLPAASQTGHVPPSLQARAVANTGTAKRKREAKTYETDTAFGPPSSQVVSKIGKRQPSNRSAKVNYTVPTMDAPDEAWIRPMASQLPSSTQAGKSPRVTRARSRALSSVSATSVSIPPAQARPSIPPRVRLARTSGSLSSIATAKSSTPDIAKAKSPTPEKRIKPSPPMKSRPAGKDSADIRAKQDLLGSSTTSSSSALSSAPPTSPNRPPSSKTSSSQQAQAGMPPVTEQEPSPTLEVVEEVEEDLLAEFDDFAFAPRSPTASIGHASQNPLTPSRSRFGGRLSQAELAEERKDLLLTPTKQAFMRQRTASPMQSLKSPRLHQLTPRRLQLIPADPVLSPAALERKKQADALDAQLAREREANEKADAYAKAQQEARWKERNEPGYYEESGSDDGGSDWPGSGVKSLKALLEQSKQLRRSTRQVSNQSTGAPEKPAASSLATKPSKETPEDRRATKIFTDLATMADRETSFEMAMSRSRSDTGSFPDKDQPRPDRSCDRTEEPQPPFSYPTPTSRDSSHEPKPAISAVSQTVDVDVDVHSKDWLNHMDNDTRAIALAFASEIRETNKEHTLNDEQWQGIWTADVDDQAFGQHLAVKICVPPVLSGPLAWCTKAALQGDCGPLLSLLPTFAVSLSSQAIEDLAATLLQYTFCSGDQGSLDCLLALFEHAQYNPFSSSVNLRDLASKLLSVLGFAEDRMIPYVDVVVPIVGVRRDELVADLAALLACAARNLFLMGSEAVELAPLLCLLYADPSTTSATRDILHATLAEFWPLCLAELTAVGLAMEITSAADFLPVAAQRGILRSIGISTEEGREITRWVAAEFFAPGTLPSLEVDRPHLVPGIEALENGIYTLITAMRQPEVNHRVISHKLAFLYEALEVNVLVDTLPMREQGEGHELDLVQTLISRADESIPRSVNATPLQISNKIRLGQLRAIIAMKLDTAVRRRRREEDRVSLEALQANGLGKGVGGQMTLALKPRASAPLTITG